MDTKNNRNFTMDLLRVLACFFVIHQHCAETFYGATGHVEIGDDTFFIGFNTSLGRICVPLFAMISGYFLLPMRGTVSEFFRKRVSRIVLPFLVWNAVYAVFFIFYAGDSPMQALRNFFEIFVTFGAQWSHMWYIYMLLGLYLLTPVISPWLERASKRQLRFYLLIWLLTTLLPYLNRYVNPEMWGLCFWNASPTFYYFTGFVGYYILGYYVRRFGGASAVVSLLLIMAGYIPSVCFFTHDMYCYHEYADLEMSWNFCALNIVLMTYGVFSLFTKIRCEGQSRVGRLLTDFSQRSYGIYLLHMIPLLLIHDWLVQASPSIFQTVVSSSGYAFHRIFGNVPAVLVAVPVLAVITMLAVYVIARILGLLPASRKWLGV